MAHQNVLKVDTLNSQALHESGLFDQVRDIEQ